MGNRAWHLEAESKARRARTLPLLHSARRGLGVKGRIAFNRIEDPPVLAEEIRGAAVSGIEAALPPLEAPEGKSNMNAPVQSRVSPIPRVSSAERVPRFYSKCTGTKIRSSRSDHAPAKLGQF